MLPLLSRAHDDDDAADRESTCNAHDNTNTTLKERIIDVNFLCCSSELRVHAPVWDAGAVSPCISVVRHASLNSKQAPGDEFSTVNATRSHNSGPTYYIFDFRIFTRYCFNILYISDTHVNIISEHLCTIPFDSSKVRWSSSMLQLNRSYVVGYEACRLFHRF